MKNRCGVMFLFVVFFAALGTMGIYGQSSKLIGMWQSGNIYLLITENQIMVYPNGSYNAYEPDRFTLTYSWKDTYNDGLTITIDDTFTPYFVDGESLFLPLPYHWGRAVAGRMYYLTKCTPMPASKLVGKWVVPEESGDIEVTIDGEKMVFKKGRLTQTYYYEINILSVYRNGDRDIEAPGLLRLSSLPVGSSGRDINYVPYLSMNDTHIFISMSPFPDQNTDSFYNPEKPSPLLLLIKQ